MRLKSLFLLIFASMFFMEVNAQSSGNRRISYYEEAVGNLSNQLRLMQDENAKLTGTVYTLQQEMKELKQRVQSYQSEIAELRRMITAESESRQKQMNTIADKIQKAGETIQKQQNTSVQETVDYDYYVVEAGATLSAISRATGISVARLKKENGMTSDVLRIGQKLKIPRK